MADFITLKVANHVFRVEGAAESEMLRSLPGFPVFVVDDNQEPEWCVRFGCQIQKPESYTELYNFNFELDIVTCSWGKADDGTYYFLMDSHEEGQPQVRMRYHFGSNVVEATQGGTPMMLRFAMWMALGILSCSSKMVLIHSSTIVHQNRAVLFLGESGTGKSTHTRLWLKHIPDAHLLNDDSPVISIQDGKVYAFGSPWSGKTHCYHQLQFPLAAAVRLSQAPYNKIRRLSIIEAFSSIQPSFPPALAQDEKFLDLMVDMLSEVLMQVPVYHLECLPDEAAAWTSHDAIFGPLQ